MIDYFFARLTGFSYMWQSASVTLKHWARIAALYLNRPRLHRGTSHPDLLIAGRVERGYKTQRMWLIPLFNGKPIIRQGKRGPAPRWRNPQKPAKTVVHVNTHRIKQNQKDSLKQPVITVKKGNINQYGHEVEIPGGCRVVYRPDRPMCGARVWIESLYEVRVIDLEGTDFELK